MPKLIRSNEQKAFVDVRLLFVERCEALKAFCVQSNVYFLGDTAKEIRKRLDDHLREAEYDASLTLLAAVEAALRLDFDYRQRRRLKDPRSKEVRRIAKLSRGHFNFRISLVDLVSLLAIGDSVPNRIRNSLKICFKYRHWLAHGRYWRLNLGRQKPTFTEIYQLAQTIENVLLR